MADTIENPTIEEGIVPEPEVTPPANDVDSLIAELEKAGITKPEELQGKLDAGTQAGQLANLLGDTRAELKVAKDALEATRNIKPNQNNEFDFPEEGNADLEGLFNKVLDKRDRVKTEQAQKAQKAVLGMWNEIQSDPDYHLVKDVWETKIKDPNFVFKIQSGLVNPVKEFNSLVRDRYRGVAKRSLETIKTLTGKPNIQPPHVEEGGPIPPIPTGSEEDTEEEKTINALNKKLDGGKNLTQEDELAAIDAILRR